MLHKGCCPGSVRLCLGNPASLLESVGFILLWAAARKRCGRLEWDGSERKWGRGRKREEEEKKEREERRTGIF